MATKYEYKVSNGGRTGGLLVIDTNGNVRPNSVFGNTFFVDYRNGSDSNDGKSKDKAFKTLSAAHTAVTDNNNDVVFVDGDSTVVETATVAWTKSRCTVIGVGGGIKYGQGAKISLGVTTAVTDLGVLKVTGNRNRFVGLKFISNNTQANSIWGVVEGGEYNVYENCEFYKSTDLDQSTSAELLLNGDSTQFYGCTFGSLADARVGTVIRPNVWLGKGVAGAGKVSRDILFEDCLFWVQASHTTTAFVHAPAATDVERQMLFKGCGFINAKNAGATPAQAISCAATLTVGNIILDPTCYTVGVTKVSTSTGVIVTGAAPSSGTGIGVNAA